MSFLNPILLAGAAAIAVPIIIHLLNKRQFTRVTWAAMRFLKSAIEQNQRRIRIEDLLLLLLRCAILVLLALALARPALRSAAGAGVFGQAKVTGVIVIDNSGSMTQTDGVSSAFDRAKTAAGQVLDAMPSGSSTSLLLSSDSAVGLIPEPTFDLALARKMIMDASISERATDVMPALRQAIEILARRSAARKEIYFITDGQRLGWRQLDTIQSLLNDARQKEILVHLVLVGEAQTQNLGVSNLRMAFGLAPLNWALPFEVQVKNYGKDPASEVAINLRLDDEPNPIAEATIDAIPAGEVRSIRLPVKLPAGGDSPYHTITASLRPDHMPADDTRTVAVRGLKQVKVLMIDGDPGTEARESETFWLKGALLHVPAPELEQHYIKVTVISPGEFAAAKLDDYDAVFVANMADFSDEGAKNLKGYVSRGGGAVFFPGPNTILENWNDKLVKQLALLPATLSAAKGDPKAQEATIKLKADDTHDSIVSIWSDPAAGSLASPNIYCYFPMTPAPKLPAEPGVASASGEPWVVLHYADNTPAVMARNVGEGRVIMFSSTADVLWNDMPLHSGVWVPLVYRTLGAVLSRQDESLNVPVGSPFIFRGGGELLGHDATISRAGDDTATKLSQRIELVNSSATLQVNDTNRAGAYDVAIADPPIHLKFAAQPSPAESSLEPLNGGDLEVLSKVVEVVHFKAGDAMQQNIETARIGTEIWLPFAILALFAAVSETVLSQWFSRSK